MRHLVAQEVWALNGMRRMALVAVVVVRVIHKVRRLPQPLSVVRVVTMAAAAGRGSSGEPVHQALSS
jgi:hypothetical protein